MQQTNTLTRLYRSCRIFIHTLVGILIATTIWPFASKEKRATLVKWWCRRLLGHFNIQINTFGKLPNPNIAGGMFVANHISWSDIHALNSIIPLRFIAKSDISAWPVFGYLAKKSGTIFINRASRKDAARIVETTTKSLDAGDNIGFFPEGTTTDGTYIAHFKGSIMQAAINSNATIFPVAIRYSLEDGSVNTQMAYAGETTLFECMGNILKQKDPKIELHFLAPIQATEMNRQVLTKTTFDVIAKQLNF